MMTRRQANAGLISAAALAGTAAAMAAPEKTTMKLPPPRAKGGKPLIEALTL